MGRWSRLVAPRFVRWLHAPAGPALDRRRAAAAVRSPRPSSTSPPPPRCSTVDPSAGFVEEARRRVDDERVRFDVMAAEDLPAEVGRRRRLGAGAQLHAATRCGRSTAMARAAPGGTVAAYVWDYGGRMEMLRTFWDVACALDASAIDRGRVAPVRRCASPARCRRCGRGPGSPRCAAAAWRSPWSSATSTTCGSRSSAGTGTAPAYVATLDDGRPRPAARRAGADGARRRRRADPAARPGRGPCRGRVA